MDVMFSQTQILQLIDLPKGRLLLRSNSSWHQWFEQIDRNLGENIKKEWIGDMQKLVVSFPSFLWFLTFMFKKGLNDVYTLPSTNVQTSLSKVSHLANATSMVSIHPPTHQPIKLCLKEKIVYAFPYKSGREGMDNNTVQLGDPKKVHKQANYTNAILNTITEQLN